MNMSLKSRCTLKIGKWLVKNTTKSSGIRHKLALKIVKIIALKLVKEMKTEMETEQTTKAWYKSRTVWTAIIGVLLGAVQPISSALGTPVEVPIWIYEILGAFGLYTLRAGDKSIN